MTFLTTKGSRGHAPEWASLLLTARDLNCAPWELAEQPLYWQQWNTELNSALNQAQDRRAQIEAAHADNRRALGVE